MHCFFFSFFRLEDSEPYDPDAIDIPKELDGLYPAAKNVESHDDLIRIYHVTVNQLRTNTDSILQTRQHLEELQKMAENIPHLMTGIELIRQCNAQNALRLQIEEHDRLEKLKTKLEELNQRIAQHAFENSYRHSMNKF